MIFLYYYIKIIKKYINLIIFQVKNTFKKYYKIKAETLSSQTTSYEATFHLKKY
jgi:hypothetical protein